jgi:hypothetical protein
MARPILSPKHKKQKTKKKPNHRVRFQALDIKEQKRLREIHVQLKNQGYRSVPKKVSKHSVLKKSLRYLFRYFESLSKNPQSTLLRTVTYLIQPALFGFALGYGLILGSGFFGLGLTLNASISLACLSSTMFMGLKVMQRFRIQKAKEIDCQHFDWIKDNRNAYVLGYGSKEWLPYLKSYIKMDAYLNNTAYQVGLEHALDGDPCLDTCEPDRSERVRLV